MSQQSTVNKTSEVTNQAKARTKPRYRLGRETLARYIRHNHRKRSFSPTSRYTFILYMFKVRLALQYLHISPCRDLLQPFFVLAQVRLRMLTPSWKPLSAASNVYYLQLVNIMGVSVFLTNQKRSLSSVGVTICSR